MTGTTTGPFGGEYTPDPLGQFLARVVPWSPDSYVNIHAFGGTGRLPYKGGGRAFQGLEELGLIQSHVDYLNSVQAEIFFCISAQKENKGLDERGRNRRARRSRENVHLIKSFVLDLDVKPKGYPSQRAALAAVLPFFEGLGLEPGFIVSTGRGLHVYVVLPEPITHDRWQPLADALIAACAAHGIKHDVSVTRDPARILRLPTSSNRKDPNNLLLCKVLGTGRDMPLAEVEAALLTFKSTTPVRANGGAPKIDLSVLPPRPPITGPEHERVLAEIEHSRVVTSIDLLRGACPVVESSYQRGGDGDRQPLWFELAKLLHYVKDGRDWFHHLSCDDDRYDFAQADKEYTRMVPRGWPACSTIAAASDAAMAICKECPQYNKGYSPIHAAVGIVSKLNEQPYVNGINGHDSSDPFVTTVAAPIQFDLPPGYSFNDQHCIVDREGKRVFETPILGLTTGFAAGEQSFEFTIPLGTADGRTNRVTVSGGTIMAQSSAASVLPSKGLWYKDHNRMKGLMTDFQTMIRSNRTAHNIARLGWTYDSDGKVEGFSYGHDRSSPPDLTPRGSLDAWRSAANFFIGKGCVDMELLMATAFAAPLVPFTGVDGLIVFARSNTGFGKTAAIEAGASVWGSRKTVTQDATDAGIMDTILTSNNLPVYYDEMVPGTQLSRKFGGLILNVSAGKERKRAGRDGVGKPVRASQTLLVGASNYSLIDIASGADNAAIAARVIEIEMSNEIKKLNLLPSQVAEIRAQLEANYGRAGEVYAEFLAKHHEEVKRWVKERADWFQQQLSGSGDERFWVNGAAAISVAAEISRKLNLMMFDTRALTRRLLDRARQLKVKVADMGLNADDPEVQAARVRSFLNRNLHSHLITKWMPAHARHATPETVTMADHYAREIVARTATEDMVMLINEPALRLDCERQAKPIEYGKMRQVLEKAGYCSHVRRSLGAATNLAKKVKQDWCLMFDLRLPVNHMFLPEEGKPDAV